MASATNIEEKLRVIDLSLHYVREKLQIPKLAVGIVANGGVVFAKGYGVINHSNQLPVDRNTLFAIGSCSKAFTTFLLGQLVDEGSISWDDPIISHIPEFRLNDPQRTHHTTVKDSVAHRCGLPRHDKLWLNAKFPRDEILTRLQHLEPTFEIREKYLYNNLMYVIAGMVCERVTGQSWENLVRNRFFKKLGMTRSDCSVKDTQQLHNFATPHSEKDGKIVSIPWMDITVVGPAGSIVSSVEDMTKWIQVQLGMAGENLIRAETLKEIHAVQVATSNEPNKSNTGYGLGWRIQFHRGRYMTYHSGQIDGFLSRVSLLLEEKIGIVLLSNLDTMSQIFFNESISQISDILLGYSTLSPEVWASQIVKIENEIKASIKLPENYTSISRADRAEQYVGQFRNPGYGLLEVYLKNDYLFFSYNDYHYILIPMEERNFFVAHCRELAYKIEYKCSFSRHPWGDVSGCHINFEPLVPPIFFEKNVSQELYAPDYLKKFVGTFRAPSLSIKVTMNGKQRLIATVIGEYSCELKPLKFNTFNLIQYPNSVYEFFFSDAVVSKLECLHHQDGRTYILKIQKEYE